MTVLIGHARRVLPDMAGISQSTTPAWALPRTDGPLAQNVQVVPGLNFLCDPDDDGPNHGSPTGLITSTQEYTPENMGTDA